MWQSGILFLEHLQVVLEPLLAILYPWYQLLTLSLNSKFQSPPICSTLDVLRLEVEDSWSLIRQTWVTHPSWMLLYGACWNDEMVFYKLSIVILDVRLESTNNNSDGRFLYFCTDSLSMRFKLLITDYLAWLEMFREISFLLSYNR